jgi:predicted nucleic acid-binding protein
VHALLVVPATLPDDACADRKDVKFLECALAARAKCVVSGDRALLRASGYGGIEVVTPRRFLEQLSLR